MIRCMRFACLIKFFPLVIVGTYIILLLRCADNNRENIVRFGMSNCTRLIGKVAVVTAATQGIGFAIAKRLGEEGASVVISSRKNSNVNLAVDKLKKQGLDVEGCMCHVGNVNDRNNLFKKVKELYGGLDILVSNAAVSPSYGDILDTTSDSWEKVFDINVKSTFLLCKEAIPLLECKGGGSIIIISSIAGYTPFEMLGAYSVSKTSLVGLVKSLVPSCAKRNVRINGIAPGVITTNFSSAIWKSDYSENLLSQIPLKRFGKPDECAGAAAFLASEDASYITGETIVIGGGSTSRL